MSKLTKRTVDAIHPDPAGSDIFVWDTGDGAIKGFGVRMKPSGAASYLVQYRTREGRTRRLVLGRVGVLTPDEARVQAGDKLKEVSLGGDPSADRHLARDALTVNELADLYLRDGPAEKPNKKVSSWAADGSNIERHVKPLLGSKIAKALTQADIAKFQADVAAGKSRADIKTKKRGRAIVEGGRGTAARSLAVLGAMLQFAVGRKLIPANPAKGVRLLKGNNKERFLSEAEVARLAETLVAMEREHRLSPSAVAAVRLLLLTGCRKSEIPVVALGVGRCRTRLSQAPGQQDRRKGSAGRRGSLGAAEYAAAGLGPCPAGCQGRRLLHRLAKGLGAGARPGGAPRAAAA